jgi:hypothetical protein
MSSSRGRPGPESGQAYEETGGYQQTGAYSQSAGHAPSGAYAEERPYATDTREGRYTGQRRAEGAGGALVGTILAGALMIVSGATGFLYGLAMVIRGGFFAVHSNYEYVWTRTNWGYAELILGGLIFFAGVCVILGMTWARILGVVLAVLSAVGAFLTIPFFPVWSVVLIAFNLFIIWALLYPRRHLI